MLEISDELNMRFQMLGEIIHMRLEMSDEKCQRLEISDKLNMRFQKLGEITHMRLEII